MPRTGGQLNAVYEVRLAGGDPLIVKRIKNALAAASCQYACLRITLTRPDFSQIPLTFTLHNN